MKKNIVIVMVLMLLIFRNIVPVYTVSDNCFAAIQAILDEACLKSGVPGMSLSIIFDGQLHCFSSGYADREKGVSADENTLYELASVSKAFTAAGILLLEENGLLSTTDSIQEYLPWFTLQYEGRPVDMADITINDFLHHTSGLTNGKHFLIPEGDTPDMLLKTVEALNNAELVFPPGEQYRYGTVNYDVLGLVIEAVYGQSYEEFMKEQVFRPLGLHHTYVYAEEARASGNLAQGYRSSFLITTPYNAPEYRGNKPAGYIISSAKDMARWMSIQLGMEDGIPEIFNRVIEKSHQGNTSVADENGMYYAAGWMVNKEQSLIEHAGNNPNFTTKVSMFPNEQAAICLLSNKANTNQELVANVKAILDGNAPQTYKRSAVQLLDMFLTIGTIVCGLLFTAFFLLSLHRRKARKRQCIKKSRKIITMILFAFTAAVWFIPLLLIWNVRSTVFVWQTYSFLAIWIAFALLSAGITWFVYTYRGKDDS